MNKPKNNAKGITLIALVITIVILVILVGVTVSAAINTGLISNTKMAVANYDKAQKQEELGVDKIAGMVEIYSMEEVKAGEYTGTSNKKYIDPEDSSKVAYIPAGFTVSNVAGEKSISTGLVIYAGNHEGVSDMTTVQTTANQYVWIPVENPSDMYGTDANGNKLGKLYDFGNYSDGFLTSVEQVMAENWTEENGVMNLDKITGTREPAYLEDDIADNSSYNVDTSGNKIITKDGIQDEFNRMINSIETYKGFYIGRYELTGTVEKPTIVKGTKPLIAYASYSVNNKLMWYGLYTMCEKVESNNTDAQGKITTNMIWGSQWDQAVKKSLISKMDFLTNASSYGVYNTYSMATSGTKTSVYNIFDMSGNAIEWTLEGSSDSQRALRGR